MKTNRYFLSFLLLFALSIGSILRGQPPIPERSSPPKLVNDFANLMSADEQMRLERQLSTYNDSTSTQIAVVTIADMGEYDIFDWAIEIGKKWGIGQEQKNNGIVILVGLAPSRKVFIATGGGVQGFLPDIICKRIIDQHIVPAFKEKRFYDGFNESFQVIRGAANGEFVNENYGQNSGGSDWGFWLVIAFFILMIAFMIYLSNRRRHSAQYGSQGRNYGDSGGGWIFWGGSGFGGGGGGGFGGGGDSDSGGGFSGFGGGDFDGGGAGGDW